MGTVLPLAVGWWKVVPVAMGRAQAGLCRAKESPLVECGTGEVQHRAVPLLGLLQHLFFL